MKMKKALAVIMAVALLSAASVTAYAEDTDTDSKDGTADLELKSGGLTILDRNNEEVMGQLDPKFKEIAGLSVDFGAHYMTGLEETYESDDSEDVGVIIRDARGAGENSLWSVNVQLSEFRNKDNKETLGGSLLSFKADQDSIVPGIAPTGTGKAQASDTGIYAAGQAEVLFRSATKANMGSAGVWGANWTPSLKVPALTAEVGEHTATLTWTISDVIV